MWQIPSKIQISSGEHNQKTDKVIALSKAVHDVFNSVLQGLVRHEVHCVEVGYRSRDALKIIMGVDELL